jgi:hypothetical protein
VIDSAITFDHVRIETSDGGRAGLGNLGTLGTTGGTGGAGANVSGTIFTGKGGVGGNGGNGGNAGHGAPGPSLALAYSGDKPTLAECDLAPGKGGAGQPTLTRASGSPLPAVTGVSEMIYAIP